MIYEYIDSMFREGGLLRVRAVLAIIMTVSACIMYALQIPVPTEFVGLWGLAVGFYFMSRERK